MNRRMRRALGKQGIEQAKADANNAYHWGEVKRIKRKYDALSEAGKAAQKATLAAQIDEHLAALTAS